jgi:hypothetical protein
MNNINLKALIDQFGEPGYANSKGQLTKLNDNFWAAFYAQSRERIIFEPAEREFYDYIPILGIYDPKSADVIRTELSAIIFDGAKNWNGWFGMSQLATRCTYSALWRNSAVKSRHAIFSIYLHTMFIWATAC